MGEKREPEGGVWTLPKPTAAGSLPRLSDLGMDQESFLLSPLFFFKSVLSVCLSVYLCAPHAGLTGTPGKLVLVPLNHPLHL